MNDDELFRRNESPTPTATLPEVPEPPPIPVLVSYPVPESWSSLGVKADAAPDAAPPAAEALQIGVETRSGWLSARSVAVALGCLAVAEGVLIAWLATAPQAVTTAAPPVPLTIESTRTGDIVVVDGRTVGGAPQTLDVDAGAHTIRLMSPTVPSETIAVAAPLVAPEVVELAAAVTRPPQGGVRLSSPIEIQVLEGDRVLGSSTVGPVVLGVGTHRLQFVNGALGYLEERTVEIKSGQILPVTVSPPDGRLNINARPWAQVSIDGKVLGDTPLGNVSLPVGQHEVVFRHPQLGERRETVLVKSGVLTLLSVTLGR